ncbi:MAG: ABC transporter ATP-binding protein [Lactococcus plantarum]|nr:ABC transporter ATP-binding protein [Lactococcus plantarum]MDN6084474.1 ABC transporter ATP-binding protein [Lactococcus plantarum]
MENNNIAVKVDHVSKSFRLPTESTSSLRTTLVNRLKGIKGYTDQHVLKDISFEVEKGDFFGIVGQNGSGKSTLLKIISQIYKPEHGQVLVEGKLVSFIELGVGFNPELTGKENVYLNGAMLGFSVDEIAAMYDDIVEFAELSDFMNQKLKNYSSGMQVRLAFSVAIKAEGDVLVLDEVLAVGDESFQRKCNDYFMERRKSGKTTILVTHDMGAVQKYCNKAIMIKNGEIVSSGKPSVVAAKYRAANFEDIGKDKTNNQENQVTYLPGTNADVPKVDITLLTEDVLSRDETLKFEIVYETIKDIPTGFGFSIIDLTSGGQFSIIDDGAVIENVFTPWSTKKGVVSRVYELPLAMFNNRDFMIVGSVFTGTSEVGDFKQIGYIFTDRGPRFFVRNEDGISGPLLVEKGRFLE